jgi:biopolymer transport protein ExbD
MAKKPSERRNFSDEDMEMNLTPMMNLISILIPVLLVSTVFVEIAVINISAPAIGSSPTDEDKPDKPDKPPLNLTITVTDQGFTLAGSGGVMGGAAGAAGKPSGPTIPIKTKSVSCLRYLGTVPPPRAKNQSRGACTNPDESKTFEVYDLAALQKKLIDIKDGFPEEKRMIIAAEPDVEFEALVDVMDAGRSVKDSGGETRILFNEVILSPGMS